MNGSCDHIRRLTPHLVMVSGSHAQFDSRVRKSAATAAAAGYCVTVVAPSPDGQRTAEGHGGWTLVNVPVDRRLRDAATRPRTLGRLGYRDNVQADAAHTALAVQEHAAAGRLTRRLRLRRWVVDRRRLIMRYRQGRRIYLEPWARPFVKQLLRVPALGRWQRLAPESLDLDEAFAPVIDALHPDLLQSHDVQTINVVAGASARGTARGQHIPWIYDAHEYVAGLSSYSPDRLAGLIDLEASYIRRADAVITVCDPIADNLWRQFNLAQRPSVVLNAPALPAAPATASPGAQGQQTRRSADTEQARPSGRCLHADTGLAPGTPIVVYSGKVDAARGIDDLSRALVHLPRDIHVVLITNRPRNDSYLTRVHALLDTRGCAERLHTVPYVASEELVGYLSDASIGFAGFSHIGNHEVALPNKFFDYLHAGVPVVVSDLKLLADLVPRLGVGQVYPFGNAQALASVIERMLHNRDDYLTNLTDPVLRRTYSWQAQEPTLLSVYNRLVARQAEPVTR
jgi:glycosyltransferase involved in cell wall biosynthesis